MILKLGSRGPDVVALQTRLRAAGYDCGAADGDYGARTAAAVLRFQVDRPDIDDDGIAGPMTLGALDAAISPAPVHAPLSGVLCNALTWSAFEQLRDALVACPVRYGPGRGLWENGRYLVTYSPGRRVQIGDLKRWPNMLGKTFPSLHCTSLTNLVLSWLDRRNQDFTHAGNSISLFKLVTMTAAPRYIEDVGVVRGFGNICTAIEPDGSGARRTGFADTLDMRELFDRRDSLPTFMVFGQSTRRPSGWNLWHHTGVLAVREGKLFRFAADGFKGVGGYSGAPVSWSEITTKNVGLYAAAAYRVFGVSTADGTYGDTSRPIARVVFE